MILLKFHDHFESEILLTRQLKSTRYLNPLVLRIQVLGQFYSPSESGLY